MQAGLQPFDTDAASNRCNLAQAPVFWTGGRMDRNAGHPRGQT
jgi:hypothetical protein